MNNSHYIITFDDAYLDGRNFNIESNQTIHGRLMLLALVPMDQSQPYEYTYQLVGGRNEYAYVFDDVIVQDIISKIEVYGGQSNNEFKFIYDVIGLYSDEYWDAHVGMTDITHAWLPLNSSNNIYISLDPNYSTPSGNKSNKVLRTLATGQSDITRHEAYTKATGLNEFNSLTPGYSNNQGLVTYEYVDLGLPSGTLWAKMNVGAKSETDTGLYFAWGETQGYADASTKAFSWSDYKYWTSSSNLTKYNATDGKTALDLEDDAAHVNMGGNWHMPNKTQCEELFKETKNGFVTNAGAFTQYAWSDSDGYSSPTQTTATISNWDTAGYFFFKNSYTSVTDAISAEDYLFIPAAGSCSYGKVNDVGEWGGVWSSSLDTDLVNGAWDFYFGSDEAGVNSNNRCDGQSVRGVIGELEGPLK